MFAKATIFGHLGKDPEQRTSKDGKNFSKFTVATSTGYGDKKKTTWYNVTVFGKQSDVCQQYLRKGSLILVDGNLDIDEYDGKDGKRHVSVNLMANSITLMPKSVQPNEQPQLQPQQQRYDDNPFFPEGNYSDTEPIPF